MAAGAGHESHRRVSDVSLVRAADERAELWADHQYDIDHEPCGVAWSICLLREQVRAARLHTRAGAGTRSRKDHGQWDQSGSIRHGNEYGDHAKPGSESAIRLQHSAGPVGE